MKETSEQCKIAIKHIIRIIKKKYSIYILPKESRNSFPGLKSTDLKSLVDWLLHETGSLEEVYSKQCMDLVLVLNPLLPGL